MIRKYGDDSDVLEYLESFMSSIARILEDENTVNWDDIAGVCDQRYYSLKQNTPIPLNNSILDPIYTNSVEIIESRDR